MLPDDMSIEQGPGWIERRALVEITVIRGHQQLQAPLTMSSCNFIATQK